MARAPTSVGMSSGQGVSRRSYQVGRSLGMAGTGVSGGSVRPPPNPIVRSTAGTGGGGIPSGIRDYGKVQGPNIAYSSREMANPNIQTLSKSPGAVPPLTPIGQRRVSKGFVL